MICRLLTLSSEKEWPALAELLQGRHNPASPATGTDANTEGTVRAILDAVAQQGDAALVEYTRRYDCPAFDLPLKVDPQDIARAAATVSGEDLAIIAEAAAHIREFHRRQTEQSWFVTREDGSILGQRVTPVDRVGLYVPGGQGGTTPLISSLLMTAIPAQVAGVGAIAVVTPPQNDGSVNAHILAAAHLLDIDEIYRVGSAWAVAALAYGTKSIPQVDVIAGPGNIYVTTAKRLVQGRVGIDMIAGPSEILVLADATANPAWIAADMLSQAEHDTLASAICITDSPALAEAVLRELEEQCAALPRATTAYKALVDWSAVVITPNMRDAIALANLTAPEHLQICTRDPWALLPHIRHAGAIFLGGHAPEPVGDYYAGPNHVLPTMGTARFASALSVQTFCKKSSVVATSPGFIQRFAPSIARLARMEGLEAHARAVEYRAHKGTSKGHL